MFKKQPLIPSWICSRPRRLSYAAARRRSTPPPMLCTTCSIAFILQRWTRSCSSPFFPKARRVAAPKYLSTILKEVMNRRPRVYIQLFTMKAIERRLRFTDMTMQEIANDLNFPNPSFFGKYFKEHTGITPMEYRMKYQLGD